MTALCKGLQTIMLNMAQETVKQNSSLLSVILTWLLPIFIFIGIGQLISKMMMKKMGGGPAMTFGKANAKYMLKLKQALHLMM